MFKPSQTFLVIILSICFGLLSGFLGFIIISASSFSIPILSQLNLSSATLNDKIVIQQPRSVVVEQDTQMKQIENDLLPAVVNIYHSKKAIEPLNAAFTGNEVLGHGFVLTADGWVVSSRSVISNLKGTYAVVGYQNKQYSLSDFVEDQATGVVFGKMPANNLPVAKLGDSSSLSLGQTVVVVSGHNQLELAHIARIGYVFSVANDLKLKSDYPQKRIHLDRLLADSYNGGLLVNLKGEVIGVIDGGSAIPVDYFSQLVSGLLNNKKIVRASLGVDYIDLAQTDGLINWGDKGAYVISEPARGTAAFDLVQKGDIIKKINDSELNVYQGLADVINDFKMGDKVEIVLSRNGQDVTVVTALK
ncbi:MAG: S1C family serine protease [Candidatus Buchananbacteria bacterium]